MNLIKSPARRLWAADLERFFRRIPADKRYHLELRTEAYLVPQVFDVLARLGMRPFPLG